eukprot:14081214-Alexandrium_andersonii.AAC.1
MAQTLLLACFLAIASRVDSGPPLRTSMLVESVQLGLSRCAGRATMPDSPCGRGGAPPQRLIGPP